MRKSWLSVVAATSCLWGSAAMAADHRDGPAVSVDGSTDIADVFTWMSADGAKAYMVMTLAGGATGASSTTKFSDKAVYVFNITSGPAFGMKTKTDKILCTFSADATQKVSCWGPNGEYVTGNTGDTAGAASVSGKLKVFAGLRDDPFFFNVRAFKKLTATVKSVAGNLMFDPAGCPTIDMATSAQLVGLLKSDGNMGPGTDDFAKGGASTSPATTGNVLSIVLAVDKTLINSGGSAVSVWASTNKAK